MKRICSVFIALTIIIVGLSTTTFAENITDSAESKIRYYYVDEVTEDFMLSTDANVFNNAMNPDDTVEVVFELDYDNNLCSCRNKLSKSSTNDEVQAVKRAHREEMRKKHLNANMAFIDKYDFSQYSSDYVLKVGEFSPYVQILFDEYVDYVDFSDEILDVANDSEVLGISIGLPVEHIASADIQDSSDAPLYPIEDAIADMGASDQTYNGEGIKVGIIEAGGIAYDNSSSDLNNVNIFTNGTEVSDHAINVTRILCGAYGVARNVDAAYIYHSASSSSMIDAMDWMVDNQIDVVNISKSTQNLNGQYHWTSAMLDYYVKYNYVLSVASAGNTANDGTIYTTVSNYAMGYNVIAVGAMDAEYNISSYSSFGVNSNIKSRKPTISAPGTNIVINGDNLGSGTSYSAPMVTGIIAKLMDESPYYIVYPEALMAILIASATPVSGQGESWDAHAGSGCINFQRAIEASNNCMPFSFSQDSIGVRETETIQIEPGKQITIAMFWYANSSTTTPTSIPTANIHTDYDFTIRGKGNSSVVARGAGFTNIEYVKYTNTSYDALIIELRQASTKLTDDVDYGGISWIID